MRHDALFDTCATPNELILSIAEDTEYVRHLTSQEATQICVTLEEDAVGVTVHNSENVFNVSVPRQIARVKVNN